MIDFFARRFPVQAVGGALLSLLCFGHAIAASPDPQIERAIQRLEGTATGAELTRLFRPGPVPARFADEVESLALSTFGAFHGGAAATVLQNTAILGPRLRAASNIILASIIGHELAHMRQSASASRCERETEAYQIQMRLLSELGYEPSSDPRTFVSAAENFYALWLPNPAGFADEFRSRYPACGGAIR